jgi:hypothetical protein
VGSAPAEWHVAGTGDFNGDSTSDILWRHSDGTIAVWLMNGASPGAVLSGGSIARPSNDWTIAGVGKFFGGAPGDRSAILWRSSKGGLAIWRLNGLAVDLTTALGSATIDWSPVGVGDFNGDGTSDILWRNMNGSVVAWMINNGAFLSGGTIASAPASWSTTGARDVNFNVNVKNDLVWRNTNGSVVVWFLDGASFVSSAVTGNAANAWNIASVASFSGTNADILWRHTNGGVAIWSLNTSGGVAGSAGLGVVP